MDDKKNLMRKWKEENKRDKKSKRLDKKESKGGKEKRIEEIKKERNIV
jgi:hypothetical protein